MTAKIMIGIVFRLINFSVLIFIGYEAIRRYLLPFFKEQLYAKTVLREQVQAEQLMLVKDVRSVERAILDDRTEQDFLKKRVDTWRDRVEQEYQKRNNEHQDRLVMIQKKRAMQSKDIEQERLFHDAVPHALEIARTDLRKQFADADAQKKYMNRLVERMKESV